MKKTSLLTITYALLLCFSGCESERVEKTITNEQPAPATDTKIEDSVNDSLKRALESMVKQFAATKNHQADKESENLDGMVSQLANKFPDIYKITPEEKEIIAANNRSELTRRIQTSYNVLDKYEVEYAELLKHFKDQYTDKNLSIHEQFILYKLLSEVTKLVHQEASVPVHPVSSDPKPQVSDAISGENLETDHVDTKQPIDEPIVK